ncbi:Ubiquitin carboxyl-terminal hydrolase and Peptidase C19 domain containing protein [Aphelenchoides besseyi]|nr:Ubiquitin carboxyl-terminal hydrolase and Peptidase C19 domain containing protein [Aphelenchoides besseyi]
MTCASNINRRITVKEAKKIVEKVKTFPLELGDSWYLIVQKWWNKFNHATEHCPDEGFDMPPINNEDLVEFKSTESNKTFYKLKDNMTESIKYSLVPETVFNQLKETFGVVDEQRDVIARKVVNSTVLKKDPFVEVYPLRLKIAKFNRRDDVRTLEVSYSDTFDQLKEKAFELLKIPSESRKNAQIMVEKNDYEFEAINEKLSPSLDSILQMDMVFYVEDSNTRVLRSSGRNADDLNGNPRRASANNSSSQNYPQGLCGLQNLGNTCFMNSALQCLSNVPELTDYFLSKKVGEEINSSNVLGTGGKLAKAYQELIREMWSGNAPSVKPYTFKCIIGTFAPRFNGYNQQDAQELMAFLLDGLHEDLNRIYDKPYVEEKESDGREDKIVAQESWTGYKKRNDSIIVDLMHGQLKSTVTCNICSKTSIKFDPFCFLSVPVPTKERQQQSTILIFHKSEWQKFNVSHTNKTQVKQITALFKKRLNLSENERLVLATTYGHGKTILDEELLVPQQYSYSGFGSGRTLVGYVCQNGPLILVENNSSATFPKTLSYPIVLNFENSITADRIIQTVAPFMAASIWREHKLTAAVQNADYQPIFDAIKDIGYEANGENAVSLLKNHIEEDNNNPTGPVTILITWNETDHFLTTSQLDNTQSEDVVLQSSLKRHYTLEECIEMFTMREQLEANEAWYCPNCKKHQCAFKKLDVWELPRILIVHLKRFLYTRYNREKIDTEIVIPVKNFSPKDKVANQHHTPVTYDLIAISNHMGGLGSGHYTAKAFCKTTQRWCDFNDSSATPCNDLSDPLTSREAYILVYRQRNESSRSRNDFKQSDAENMDTSA